MKTKAVAFGALVVFVLAVGYGHIWAKTKSQTDSSRMGVVGIRYIFRNCKRNQQFKQETQAQQDQMRAELNKLQAEIDAGKAGLQTLKVGSDDYLEQARSVLEKQAQLQAKQNFYQQQLAVQEQQWTKALYQDIVRIVDEVAAQQGLDVVFAADEVDFNSPNVNDLLLSIRLKKLLYKGGCVDITDEVLARLDAGK